MPSWIGPTVALSLLVIALAFVAIAVVLLRLGMRAADESKKLSQELAELRRDVAPTIQALNKVAGVGEELGSKVRQEVLSLLTLSRRLRRSVRRGAGRVKERLDDLDALYEVVRGEVEETALDVAATLRTVRTGASALSRIKRLLVRGRK